MPTREGVLGRRKARQGRINLILVLPDKFRLGIGSGVMYENLILVGARALAEQHHGNLIRRFDDAMSYHIVPRVLPKSEAQLAIQITPQIRTEMVPLELTEGVIILCATQIPS